MKHAVLAGILLVGTGCSQASTESSGLRSTTGRDLRLIGHVIVIMQENRSFDHYFGTYPGADGIPMQNGVPDVCMPNPRRDRASPFHDSARRQCRWTPRASNAVNDIDGGRMDGFIAQAEDAQRRCINPYNPVVRGTGPLADVMGYHDNRRDPELLVLCTALRASGPPVRTQCVVELARAPIHGVRVVGALQHPQRLLRVAPELAGGAQWLYRQPRPEPTHGRI